MQKIFHDCYDMDAKCYLKFGLNEDILMEHAASGMAEVIKNLQSKAKTVLIAAGPGNNGADGITLARELYGDYDVTLYLLTEAKSNMAKLQLNRAKSIGIMPIYELDALPKNFDIVVDALFGAGLSKPLNNKSIELINMLNVMDAYKIACDIPTGIDKDGTVASIAFKADITCTMGALKRSLFGDGAKPYIGKIKIIDLGVARTIYENHTDTFLIEQSDFNPPVRRNPNSHKGNYGHLCVIAGEKKGAAILCASAALRFGAGLVTLIHKTEIPNLPYSLMISNQIPKNCNAIALGMGMGKDYDPKTIESLLKNKDISYLLDADICYEPWVETVIQSTKSCVITPHPKEFSALLHTLDIANIDTANVQSDRFGWAKKFSMQYPKCVLVLKGANTLIAYDGTIYVNPLATAVLSQAGSGDVLSGLIASLLAQGYSALNAAINATIAHALLARNYKGNNFSATAEDLIEEIRWIKL